MKQHRCHFDSGRRTTRGKRAYALCARDLYWPPDTPEFQQRLAADPLRVTCRACRAKPEYRAALLVLEPQIMAQVAVLLDWIMDHPGAALTTSPLGTLLAPLVTKGFPVELAVQAPQQVLGYLRAAQATNIAPEVRVAFIAQVARERADRARDRANALVAGRMERVRFEEERTQLAAQLRHELDEHRRRSQLAQEALQARHTRTQARQATLAKRENIFLGFLVSGGLAALAYTFLTKACS